MSACSPDFAPHARTQKRELSACPLSDRPGDKEPGQKDSEVRHERDSGECEHGGAEGFKANHVGRQDDKETGKRIPVELTRGDVFEVSAHMSSRSRRLPKEPSADLPERSRGGGGPWIRGAR